MLWEAGGHILTPDNKKAAFNSAAGVKALTQLRQLQQAHALYLDFHPDAGTSETLFNSGKLGMIITGPWDLSTFPDVNYGVQIMPVVGPGRQPPDDRRAGQLGGVQQRPRPGQGVARSSCSS